MTNIFSNPEYLLFLVVGLLVAITIHEFMHAWTANYLGDPTAKISGRITLNPVAHLDLLGTIAIFLIGFGWGKPVPVNDRNFKNPRLGSALTSIAGPLSNLVMAAFLSLFYKFLPLSGTFMGEMLLFVITLNIVLMVFNLIPIPPLDGSKVLYSVLPNSVNIQALEMYGPFLLLGLFFFGKDILSGILGPAVNGILSILGVPSYF